MDDAEAFHDLHAAIGRFAVTWASLEMGLDLLILLMRRHEHAAQRESKEPHNLSNKIRRAKKQIKEINTVNAFRTEVLSLLGEMERLSHTRHDIVHGAAMDMQVGETSVSVLMTRLFQPVGPRRPARRFDAAEIEHIADEIWSLGGRMLDVLEAIPRASTPEA